MSDNPNKAKEVPMNTAEVPQHHRMAAGEKCDGQHTPSSKQTGPKTPA